jgi:hypothetical protein
VVFCHNISAEFAAFFFRKKRDQDKAEALKRRECLYKDFEGTIREIITPTIPDDTATRVAELLLHIAAAPQSKQLCQPPQYEQPPQRHSHREFAFPALPEPQVPQQRGNHPQVPTDDVYYMPRASLHQDPEFYHAQTTPFPQTGPLPRVDAAASMARRPLPEQIAFPGPEESDRKAIDVSFEEERTILQAVFDLQKELGRVPHRTEIRDHLEWNNKQYPKIALICDRYRIAMPNGGRSA